MGLVVAALAVSLSVGTVPQSAGPISFTRVTINASTGDQFDPHVDADLAAYSEITATQQIRYYLFSTATDAAISNVMPDGSVVSDLLSDVQGGRIVFTRIGADRNAIMLFDPATMTSPQEINPQVGSNRIGVAIGGPSLAYVDLGLATGGEIVHVDLNTNAVTRLTNDSSADQSVAVSPDGKVIVWEHCETNLAVCNINQGVLGAGGWTVSPVTSSTFAQESPDTNGTLVVYDSNRGAASDGYDLFYRPVGGGAESQLQLPGDQVNASISGGIIAFESRAVGSTNSDIFIYEIATNRTFQITATPTLNESLNDVTVLANGDIRLVWDSNDEIISRNVYGATFSIPHQNTCANRTVTLDASRTYSPTHATDGTATLSPAMQFVLPAAIPVTAGNSGNKKITLSITSNGVTTRCQYRGGSNQPHPTTPAEVARGLRYVFDHCTGQGHALFAGDQVTADHLTLHVDDGDQHAGTTRVHLVLAESCTGTSVFGTGTGTGGSCQGRGHDDDGDDDDDGECADELHQFGCSSTGGTLGPVALAFGALLLVSRRRRLTPRPTR